MTKADAARSTTSLFEYIGRTRLLVIGPVTRTSYRFAQPGARVLVDGRGRTSRLSIPVLCQVGG